MWNIATIVAGLLIGLWLFNTCFLWNPDKTRQAFDRCVVPRVVAIAAVIVLVGVVAALRTGVVTVVVRKRGDRR